MKINLKIFQKRIYQFLLVSSMICLKNNNPYQSQQVKFNQNIEKQIETTNIARPSFEKWKQYTEIKDTLSKNPNLTEEEKNKILKITRIFQDGFYEIDLSLFQENMETVDIEEAKLNKLAGVYNPSLNVITLGSTDEWVLSHELGHTMFLGISKNKEIPSQMISENQIKHGYFLEEGINSQINIELNQKDSYKYIRQYIKMLGELYGRERLLNERAYGSKGKLIHFLYQLNPNVSIRKVDNELEQLVLYAQKGKRVESAESAVALIPDFTKYYFSLLEKNHMQEPPFLTIEANNHKQMHLEMVKTAYYTFQLKLIYRYLLEDKCYQTTKDCLEYLSQFNQKSENYLLKHYGQTGKETYQHFYNYLYNNEKIYLKIQENPYFTNHNFSISYDTYQKKYHK